MRHAYLHRNAMIAFLREFLLSFELRKLCVGFNFGFKVPHAKFMGWRFVAVTAKDTIFGTAAPYFKMDCTLQVHCFAVRAVFFESVKLN